MIKTKYQWLYTSEDDYSFLHYIDGVNDWGDKYWRNYDSQFSGERPWRSECGLSALFVAPGVASRLGLDRCPICCDKINIPSGKGCPLNDINLNPR